MKHTLLRAVAAADTLGWRAERRHLYFGYGANLSIERFRSRRMNVAELGNAVLDHHQVRFTLANEYLNKGYAGVHPAAGEKVWGVLYSIDTLSLKLLDTLEWCGFGAYERKLVTVHLAESDRPYECWCYFVKYPRTGLSPSHVYRANMIKASTERGFPQDYIDQIAAHPSKGDFPLDHSFSLLFYGKKRWLAKSLRPLYVVHDRLREKLCDLL